MLKAITTYLHKITFGNTEAQQHEQFPKHFNKKYYFCLPQLFAKLFWSITST